MSRHLSVLTFLNKTIGRSQRGRGQAAVQELSFGATRGASQSLRPDRELDGRFRILLHFTVLHSEELAFDRRDWWWDHRFGGLT